VGTRETGVAVGISDVAADDGGPGDWLAADGGLELQAKEAIAMAIAMTARRISR
jgi:hypothetical protein